MSKNLSEEAERRMAENDDDFNAMMNGIPSLVRQQPIPSHMTEPRAALHPDSIATDRFALAMKAKLELSRTKGRSGWECCAVADLWQMLREHVQKGDPVDVANIAMMIWHNERKCKP